MRSEGGGDLEIQEEEDDLLRAAEELGIDLSGVRATDDATAATVDGDLTEQPAPVATEEPLIEDISTGEIVNDDSAE